MRALDRLHQIWYEAYLTTNYPSYQHAVEAAARRPLGVLAVCTGRVGAL